MPNPLIIAYIVFIALMTIGIALAFDFGNRKNFTISFILLFIFYVSSSIYIALFAGSGEIILSILICIILGTI
ncbi:hypothetical protein, partial [Acidianus sp. RZ1]|uniref:hypothetical protein n=1 Tax=Acidianus sp. RZ1 TaxID=1540082 RepID=UPI001490C1FD